MIVFQSEGLTVFQSALFQTNSTVVAGQGFVLVVDPAWLPQEVEEIAKYVGQVHDGRPVYLLFTHSDFDHILGGGAFPGAITLAGQKFVDNPEKEQSVQKVHAWDSEYYVNRPYDIRYPEIDIVAARDGQELVIGRTRLTFYGAPGHNPDGVFTVIEPQGILIAGDYLSDIEFPYISQSSAAYEETLGTIGLILAHHAIRVLVPGHGRVATDPQEMQQRRHQSTAYILALRRHLSSEDQAAMDALLEGYAFPEGMKTFHEANKNLMRKEASSAKAKPQP